MTKSTNYTSFLLLSLAKSSFLAGGRNSWVWTAVVEYSQQDANIKPLRSYQIMEQYLSQYLSLQLEPFNFLDSWKILEEYLIKFPFIVHVLQKVEKWFNEELYSQLTSLPYSICQWLQHEKLTMNKEIWF